MDFTTWTRRLSHQGIRVISPSHPTPIRVRALLRTGDLIEFLCRGTSATLTVHGAADLIVGGGEPAPLCGCGCGDSVGDSARALRLDVRAGARPIRLARFDGSVERGWARYEAGLLGVDEAAPIFDSLLADIAPLGQLRREPMLRARSREEWASLP